MSIQNDMSIDEAIHLIKALEAGLVLLLRGNIGKQYKQALEMAQDALCEKKESDELKHFPSISF